MKNLLHSIDEKKQKLDAHRPLDSAVLKNLEQWFTIALTHNLDDFDIFIGTAVGKSLDIYLESCT